MSRTTQKEDQVYNYIKDTLAREGYSPSIRDIQQALNIKSTSTVHSYLKNLEDRNLIRKSSGKSRSLCVNEAAQQERRKTVRVPLVGEVAAGKPILAEENIKGYFEVPATKHYLGSELFALKVKGESMIEAGIMPGDIIIVHQTPLADNGDIVVALLDDSATVKTFYKENGHYRLQPQNRTMDPIIVDSVMILGKVVYLLRLY